MSGGYVTDKAEAKPLLPTAIRTLLASGFKITGADHYPRYAEISCERSDLLGATVPYRIAITDMEAFSAAEVDDIHRSAKVEGRVTVLVSASASDVSIGWADFLAAQGGAVPHWRALADTYEEALLTAATNQLPPQTAGEAWQVFELLVADGLEFIFARLVHRLGGQKRGERVGDILAMTPDARLIVVDAKAARSPFDATWGELRPLVEYVQRQRARQQGQPGVAGGLLVSSAFRQPPTALASLAADFLAHTSLPLSFIDSAFLAEVVQQFRRRPELRSAIRWSHILRPGYVALSDFEREFKAAANERVTRG
jgi:hypothetical protein